MKLSSTGTDDQGTAIIKEVRLRSHGNLALEDSTRHILSGGIVLDDYHDDWSAGSDWNADLPIQYTAFESIISST